MAGLTDELRALGAPRILELGTKRSNPSISTMQKHNYPFAGEYIGTDIQEGPDVDVVSDVHTLSKTFGEESFDFILAFSVFEHVKYPQIASHEIMKTLKIRGHVFIMTHFIFHEHGFPFDYYRFTTEGMKALFPPTMNCVDRGTAYVFPCEIHSEEMPWNPGNRAFLNVHHWSQKTGKTPPHFIPDLTDLVPKGRE